MLNESSSSRAFVILNKWSFGSQKNNDLVFEFMGEGCHRTAKSQDKYLLVVKKVKVDTACIHLQY